MKQVKDPVCGMMIDPATAAGQTTRDDTTYYFCSDSCRTAFESEPDQYTTEKHEPPFTVSKSGMTAPKFGSAGSGGAELEPGPERHGKK